jgi:hypothetical protein
METLESRNLAGVRWIFRIFCWLAGGVMFLKSAFMPVPDLAALREFSARVSSTEESEAGNDHRLNIRFEGRNGTYHLPAWIPEWRKISEQILIGRELHAWSDIGGGYMLWQIEIDGTRLLSHEVAAQAASRRRWPAAVTGVILLGLPFLFWFIALAKHRRVLKEIRERDQAK